MTAITNYPNENKIIRLAQEKFIVNLPWKEDCILLEALLNLLIFALGVSGEREPEVEGKIDGT